MIHVLSYSGGVDSTSLLLHLLRKKEKIFALTFNYGQKHQVEIKFAKRNILYLSNNGFDINHKVIDLSNLMDILQSSLTDNDISIPEGHYMDDNMKSTFVPNRNAIFSSIIYGYCLSLFNRLEEQVTLSLGVHSGDHVMYPDCRPEFYDELMKAFKLGNWESEHVDFYLPYIDLDKTDVIKDGIESCNLLDIDYKEVYKNTLTTYAPDENGFSNGRTGSDVERILAFYDLGIEDPGNYNKSWDLLVNYALQAQNKIRKS